MTDDCWEALKGRKQIAFSRFPPAHSSRLRQFNQHGQRAATRHRCSDVYLRGCLTDWSSGWLIRWLAEQLTDWSMLNCPTAWMASWQTEVEIESVKEGNQTVILFRTFHWVQPQVSLDSCNWICANYKISHISNRRSCCQSRWWKKTSHHCHRWGQMFYLLFIPEAAANNQKWPERSN